MWILNMSPGPFIQKQLHNSNWSQHKGLFVQAMCLCPTARLITGNSSFKYSLFKFPAGTPIHSLWKSGNVTRPSGFYLNNISNLLRLVFLALRYSWSQATPLSNTASLISISCRHSHLQSVEEWQRDTSIWILLEQHQRPVETSPSVQVWRILNGQWHHFTQGILASILSHLYWVVEIC